MVRTHIMNGLHARVEDYLAVRRSLGFKLRGHDRMLNDFVDHLERAEASTITIELAVDWAVTWPGVQPYRWKQRLSVVRGFARYLQGLDPTVQVPPADLLPYRHRRPTPFLYTESEITAVLAEASALAPAFRAITFQTLIGLLAATGMRIGEAIRLDRDDVDFGAGTLLIRDTKFNKSRRLPLHSTTVTALQEYSEQRDRLSRSSRSSSFFVSTVGTRLVDVGIHSAFRTVIGRVGLEPRAGSGRPRVHDFRHTFAVSTVRDWYRDDADVASKLPLLSAYLGHVGPVSTYWYLQTDPELMGLAAGRLGRTEDSR
jgi:integrase/recombinase XerD